MTKLDPAGLVLVSSSREKLAEFRELGLGIDLEPGRDLPEADSRDAIEVVVHKALAAGEGRVVEDSSLDVEGAEIGANVRWLAGQLGRDPSLFGKRAVHTVLLAVFQHGEVRVFRGELDGTVVPERGSGWSFGPSFSPDGSGGLTLAEIEALGRKSEFSARRRAAEAMLAGDCVHRVRAERVPAWKGAWQNA